MAMPNGRMSAWGLARRRRLESSGARGGVSRRVRRRLVAGSNPVAVPRFPKYFADQPNRKFAKLKYHVNIGAMGPAVGALKAYEFRANGMYDPEVAIGGHQPYGFDQLIAQYNHYTVLKCVCEIEMASFVSYTNICAMLACYNIPSVLTNAYAAGGVNALRELPLTSKTINFTTGDTKESNRNAYLTADMSKIFGKTPWNLIGDSRFQGDSTHDPDEDVYFGLAIYCPDNSDMTAKAFNCAITLTYYACFTEPKWFTTS